MRDDELSTGRAALSAAAATVAYDPPRLCEYGRLRVDTAGGATPGGPDFAQNYSGIPGGA